MVVCKVRKRSSNGFDNVVKIEEDFLGKVKGNGEESLYFKKDYRNILNVILNKRVKFIIYKNYIMN